MQRKLCIPQGFYYCEKQKRHLTNDCDLDHAVALVFKEFVCLVDLRERIGVRDQRLGVELAVGDEFQRLVAIAAVDAAGLEGQVLAVHFGQRQGLRSVVKCHHRDDGVRAGAERDAAFPSGRIFLFLYRCRSA